MEQKKVFAVIKRYGLLLSIGLLIIITGCQTSTTSVNNGDSIGFYHRYFVQPLAWLMEWLAHFFQGNYGYAIIAITLLIRIVLLPLMLKQYKGSQEMQRKMGVMQPELKELQARYKGKTDPQEKQKMQQEMMALYQKHQYNPLNIGCLPMLIQLPILTGLYYAIRGSEALANHSFLWFQLGQPDVIMPFIAAAVYYFQFKVSQRGLVQTPQQQQMAWIGYLSPVMMGLFSFAAPAALPLYWTVGGLFLIGQTVLGQKLYRKPNPILNPIPESLS